MSVKIAKPTDSAPSFKERAGDFFREHGWLCAGGFLAVVFATAEGRRPEAEELKRYRDEISALTADEQKELQLHAVAFRQLDSEQQALVQQVHGLVQQQPDLGETVAEYHRWLERLPKDRRDKINAESDPQKRLTAIREVRETKGNAAGDIGRNPADRAFPGKGAGQLGPGFDFMSRMGMNSDRPMLFEAAMKGLAKELGMPEKPEQSGDLALWDHHIRVADRAFKELPEDGQRSPREIIQSAVGDKLLKELKERLPSNRDLAVGLVARGLLFEGVSVIEKNSSLRETLFKDIPRDARLHFEQMPKLFGDRHLAMSHIRQLSPDLGSRIRESADDLLRPRNDPFNSRDNQDFGPPPDGPDGRGQRGPDNFGPPPENPIGRGLRGERRPNGPRP